MATADHWSRMITIRAKRSTKPDRRIKDRPVAGIHLKRVENQKTQFAAKLCAENRAQWMQQSCVGHAGIPQTPYNLTNNDIRVVHGCHRLLISPSVHHSLIPTALQLKKSITTSTPSQVQRSRLGLRHRRHFRTSASWFALHIFATIHYTQLSITHHFRLVCNYAPEQTTDNVNAIHFMICVCAMSINLYESAPIMMMIMVYARRGHTDDDVGDVWSPRRHVWPHEWMCMCVFGAGTERHNNQSRSGDAGMCTATSSSSLCI